ncbi:MAG TPA: hydroxyacid-oxoacid transhydrogenase [Thermomicrobiales bacterium]|nr:hydroxyacid-oxoacid transhydrogenase [Thermomicrobiales bacterium]
MALETVFAMESSAIKFGSGATREIGDDAQVRGCRRVMLLTDPKLAESPILDSARIALADAGVDCDIFSDVFVEPTDDSFRAAIDFALAGTYDGFVAVGGGSVIDTAKAANLYSTHPADFLAYVTKPIGEGRVVPGPLKPFIAVPTTAGTGSETTGNAVLDFPQIGTKTAIAHRHLRPSLGVIDPDNVRDLPPMVAACSGLDVLCHALESFTAVPFDERPKPEKPQLRTPYQGSNPVSDIWSKEAIRIGAERLKAAVNDPSDHEARGQMLFAATLAGIGFGNAGVHLPHALSYPISRLSRGYFPPDYPHDHSLVPHGMSVVLTAPAIFLWTADAAPQAHREAAILMGASPDEVDERNAGDAIAERFVALMKAIGMPNGLKGVGITEDDLDVLVAGTLPQGRLLVISPKEPTEADIRQLFMDSMTLW